MKKVALSAFVIFIFAIYLLHQSSEQEAAHVVPPQKVQPTSFPIPTTASSSAPPPTAGSVLNPTSTPAPQAGKYKDGQYTGDVTDAFYGNIQVEVAITGGKISDVTFLQYPNDRGTSVMINTQAMPYLKQEAIVAQNANVDIITGATQTSEAFRLSLQSALSKAS